MRDGVLQPDGDQPPWYHRGDISLEELIWGQYGGWRTSQGSLQWVPVINRRASI